jgi:nicotinate-nucleotide adenylyltransferase
VFGGAFDPVHFGHLLAAHDVRKRLGLDSVLFVPTCRPPHRPAPRARYEDRVAMLRLALRDWPGFDLCAVEHERPGPSYTVDTLRDLKRRFPAAGLWLLLGSDQYAEMGRWHKAGQLPRLARIVVMSRPGTAGPRRHPRHPAPRVSFLDVIPVDIAAAGVRTRLARNRSARYLVPRAVLEYARARRLYRGRHLKAGRNANAGICPQEE